MLKNCFQFLRQIVLTFGLRFFKNITVEEIAGLSCLALPGRGLRLVISLNFFLVPVGCEDADQCAEQVAFPRDARLVGQDAAEVATVENGDDQRQNNGLQAAPKNAAPKHEAQHPVHHTAGTDVENLAGKKPNCKAREQVYHHHAAHGHPSVEVHDDERKHENWSRIGNKVLEIVVNERGEEDAPKPEGFPWKNTVSPKVKVAERFYEEHAPHYHHKLKRQSKALKNPIFLCLHGAGIRFW